MDLVYLCSYEESDKREYTGPSRCNTCFGVTFGWEGNDMGVIISSFNLKISPKMSLCT